MTGGVSSPSPRERGVVSDKGGEPRAAFFHDAPLVAGTQILLTESEARHIAVLRIGLGERVALRDGAGNVASGTLVRLVKQQATVEVEDVRAVVAELPIHLLVPVADRERMLWLAEKAAELNVASWRPVLWHRSRSVSPRGDGPTFRQKVRARMIAGLLQSHSAWLPELYPEAPPERAIAALPDAARIVLEAAGAPPLTVGAAPPVVLAVGPEGGFERRELELLRSAGFAPVSLGNSVLRFETAAIAGVAVARAMLSTPAAESTRAAVLVGPDHAT